MKRSGRFRVGFLLPSVELKRYTWIRTTLCRPAACRIQIQMYLYLYLYLRAGGRSPARWRALGTAGGSRSRAGATGADHAPLVYAESALTTSVK